MSYGPVIGGNHLCSLRVAVMRADLDRFPMFFTKVILVWSEIIPRAVWHGARDYVAVERAQRMVNSRILRFCLCPGWVSHPAPFVGAGSRWPYGPGRGSLE